MSMDPANEPTDQPRWRDAPDVPGLWLSLDLRGYYRVVIIGQTATSPFERRWYGPIPEDVR